MVVDGGVGGGRDGPAGVAADLEVRGQGAVAAERDEHRQGEQLVRHGMHTAHARKQSWWIDRDQWFLQTETEDGFNGKRINRGGGQLEPRLDRGGREWRGRTWSTWLR